MLTMGGQAPKADGTLSAWTAQGNHPLFLISIRKLPYLLSYFHPFTPPLYSTRYSFSLSTFTSSSLPPFAGLMDLRRRPLSSHKLPHFDPHKPPSDTPAFPFAPLYLTNALFFSLFFSVSYFLLHRWRDKICTSTLLHVVTLSEIAAILSLLASVVCLLGFFGIGFLHPLSSRPSSDDDFNLDDDVAITAKNDSRNPGSCPAALLDCSVTSPPTPPLAQNHDVPVPPKIFNDTPLPLSRDDVEIVCSVVSGSIPSYSLESKLSDCRRAVVIRREVVQRITGRSLNGLPVEGFDYDSILGQCCEMPIGYVQIPVGVASPLLLDGVEYTVPMATTEGCLVASTNRGCKAIYVFGGAASTLLGDGMTRAPVVRLSTVKRAAQLKFFLEDPLNFDSLAVVFNQ